MKAPRDLEQLVDRVLIDNLPASLKQSIDTLLARGVSRPGILSFVKACAAKATQGRGGHLTVSAVEAYLDSKK